MYLFTLGLVVARDGSGGSLLRSADSGVLEVDDLAVLEEDVGLLNPGEGSEVGEVLEGLHDSLVVAAGGLVDNFPLSADRALATGADVDGALLELLLSLGGNLGLGRHLCLVL